jgi:hypothetical protein
VLHGFVLRELLVSGHVPVYAAARHRDPFTVAQSFARRSCR